MVNQLREGRRKRNNLHICKCFLNGCAFDFVDEYMTIKNSVGSLSLLFFGLMCCSIFNSCAFKSVYRSKDITYLLADNIASKPAQTLNVFAPKKSADLKNVLIFVYGGSWNSGKKELYSFFGNRWARKDVVTVIVDYPKSPKAGYDEMAIDIAKAVKWVKENIKNYGGNPDKIFISGHSAGGHLAALVAIKKEYFERVGIANPLKGIILIDAAGLDMYGYLKGENFEPGNSYLNTFSNDPKVWKEASPMYFLHTKMPPMLIYRGSKTYPSIEESNEKFVTALKVFVPQPNYTILSGKKHVPMITQFFNTGNDRYKEMKALMKGSKY